MTTKAATDIDAHVGQLIRERRLTINMSQERLGALLGVTHQQVQKYEMGLNRITVGRLCSISTALGLPCSELIPDHKGRRVKPDPLLLAALSDPSGRKLIAAWSTFPPDLRAVWADATKRVQTIWEHTLRASRPTRSKPPNGSRRSTAT